MTWRGVHGASLVKTVRHFYVAASGGIIKFGTTDHIARRSRDLRSHPMGPFTVIATHELPINRLLERVCCDAWRERRVFGTDCFRGTRADAMALVAEKIEWLSSNTPELSYRRRMAEVRFRTTGRRGRNKLTDADLVKIEKLIVQGHSLAEVGRRFGVTAGTIRNNGFRDERLLELRSRAAKSKPKTRAR